MTDVKKVYAVRRGRQPGLYKTWKDCETQVKGFPNATFQSFANEALAREYLGDGGRSAAVAPVGGQSPRAPPSTSTGFGSAKKRTREQALAANEMTRILLRDCYAQGQIVVFTDGACQGNPGGLSAAGAVLLDANNTVHHQRAVFLGQATNNVAELKAIELALEIAAQHCSPQAHVHILTDSRYVIGVLMHNWKIAKNLDLINNLRQRMEASTQRYELSWVPGHAKVHGNELVDRLVTSCIDANKGSKVRQGIDTDEEKTDANDC